MSYPKLSILLFLMAGCVVGSLAAPPPPSGGSPAEVWLTNPALQKWLSQGGNVSFQTRQSTNPLTIKVDQNIKYQQIEGFGAAMTDSSAWLIRNKLTAANRDALMNKLFSPTAGIGLNLIRMPMGATDVNVSGNYSYDDMPAGQTDPTLANFSIQHDVPYIIPSLQQALSINPSVKIMANAWSPPGWMKTSDSMIGGTLSDAYYPALANYYVRFIQAYSGHGVPISYVSPQNEPMGTPTWPGMFLSAYAYALPKGTSAMFTTTSLSSFATPVFSGMTPTSGIPGYSVTISGSNFGNAQGFGAVFFGSLNAEVTSWSNSSITVRVPQGLPSGSVPVSVYGTSGTYAGGSSFSVTGLGTVLSRAGWTATASAVSPWGDVPANMLDGNAGSRWSSGIGQSRGMWIQVDLGSPRTFDKLLLDSTNSPNDYVRKADVLVSSNGTSWTKVAAIVGNGQAIQLATFSTQTARYIKVSSTGTAGNWWSVHEFNVYSN